jgi:flagella basal body P-ring formation protein FlgA
MNLSKTTCVRFKKPVRRTRPARGGPFAAYIGLSWLVVCGLSEVSGAVELIMQPFAEVAGPIVRLGDIARIESGGEHEVTDAGGLAGVELFPAPPVGSRRIVRAVEVRDLLHTAGIGLAQLRMSGAAHVEIRTADPEKQSIGQVEVGPAAVRQAERLVRQAIVRRLTQASGRDEPWQVEFRLDSRQAAIVASSPKALRVDGGSEPWEGRQTFSLRFPSGNADGSCSIEAVVRLPAVSVVATRAIPAGAILRAADLALTRQPSRGDASGTPLSSLEEAVGRETTRALAEGQVLDRRSVRRPLWVRRGDVVTVFARAPGIEVRTSARAKDEGALGDLVSVEQPGERSRFFARVTGVREVEVYAEAAQIGR